MQPAATPLVGHPTLTHEAIDGDELVEAVCPEGEVEHQGWEPLLRAPSLEGATPCAWASTAEC